MSSGSCSVASSKSPGSSLPRSVPSSSGRHVDVQAHLGEVLRDDPCDRAAQAIRGRQVNASNHVGRRYSVTSARDRSRLIVSRRHRSAEAQWLWEGAFLRPAARPASSVRAIFARSMPVASALRTRTSSSGARSVRASKYVRFAPRRALIVMSARAVECGKQGRREPVDGDIRAACVDPQGPRVLVTHGAEDDVALGLGGRGRCSSARDRSSPARAQVTRNRPRPSSVPYGAGVDSASSRRRMGTSRSVSNVARG